MNIDELRTKYANVPNELKILKRWVCFKIEGIEDGKTTKRPYNPLSGKLAKVNDDLTWSTFDIALNGCVKYKCDGIGFILGCGIFGVDLDNHADENNVKPMSDEEFKEFTDMFVNALDSYSELSPSGNGVHIICQGKLPEGANRRGCVEMYDDNRFFTFTGNAIRNIPVNNREKEIIPLWEKYVKGPDFVQEEQPERYINTNFRQELKLSDEEIIEKAISSKNGDLFYRYYHDGDISLNDNDQSKADMSFCNLLAFFCNKDKTQMDRIFRNSALMRDKWDEKRGDRTYGQRTIDEACSKVTRGYVKTVPVEAKNLFHIKKTIEDYQVDENGEIIDPLAPKMNIDENGEPIFRIKKIYKKFPFTDTGNAERFYAYFGDLFKYNVTDKIFMFWTGTTWIKDVKDIIRKYANKLIEILHQEEDDIHNSIKELIDSGETEKAKLMTKTLDASIKNTTRISNKNGKDAMLSEFKSLYDVPIPSDSFNQNDFLLNTLSGVIDLKTGEMMSFDKDLLMSKNTNIKVSFEEPETWNKFVYSVFDNGNEEETKEMVEALQIAIGYSLSGSTREQVMFILYGAGSNGKSTLTETIADVLGDYSSSIDSNVLMQQKNVNSSAIYSIAKLQTARFVETGETDDGGKLAEAQVKKLTGSDMISAQFKYGNEFSFKPKFKIWLSTNNKPIIRGTDLGIWRRVFMFPFVNSFTGEKKDKDLPDKLKAEKEKILGWCIKGFEKYMKSGLTEPAMNKRAKEEYKDQMDIVSQFIKKECRLDEAYKIECKSLYAHYKEWSLDNTEFTLKESKFSEELLKKGIKYYKDPFGKRFYQGIELISPSVTIGKRY